MFATSLMWVRNHTLDLTVQTSTLVSVDQFIDGGIFSFSFLYIIHESSDFATFIQENVVCDLDRVFWAKLFVSDLYQVAWVPFILLDLR